MDGAELHQWWISYQVEPWGDAREDWRMAILASTMVRLHAPKLEVKLEYFLPDFYTKYRVQAQVGTRPKVDEEAIRKSQAAFLLMTQMVGGTVQRPEDVSV